MLISINQAVNSYSEILKPIIFWLKSVIKRHLFQSLFILLRVPSVSASTYYRYLKKVVYPVTYFYWLRQQSEIIQSVKVCKGL